MLGSGYTFSIMQFLTDILIGILSGYLALTSTLATNIEYILPANETRSGTATEHTAKTHLSSLTSEYVAAIPDILIENAAYQQASAIGSVAAVSQPTTDIKAALVNIYCTHTTGSQRRINTGTGFFINPKGVVLTNAHVAQFLLLEALNGEGTTECILRSGDPAEPLYEVDLLYISPAWIQKHAHLITNTQPMGTGERDFALLYVTAGLNNKPMPQYFPYLAIDTTPLTPKLIGKQITAGGYPATGGKMENGVVTLRPQTATTTITDLYTFEKTTADVIEIGESNVGAYGTSGGPIVNSSGKVIGLISTKGSKEADTRSLRGISLAYIDRTIIEESTFDIERTLSGRLELRGQLFTSTIATFLSKVLGAELQ